MRRHDWPTRFAEFVRERRRMRFDWGPTKNDCWSFARALAATIRDDDILGGVPDYASAEEVDLLTGEKPLAAWLDERLPRVEISFAQRCDVCLATLRGHETVLVVDTDALIGPGPRGLTAVPRTEMHTAWKL